MYPFKKWNITAQYGEKSEYWKTFHKGTDFISGIKNDYNIQAISNGKVRFVGFDAKGWGKYISIKDENGYIIIYAHCSEIYAKKNDIINEGDIIAKEGKTGNASGIHLHLEVRNGIFGSIDPEPYLKSLDNKTKRNTSYKKENGLHIIKIPVENFKIIDWNKPKKTTKIKNYCNAGFFASGKTTTEPMGNLIVNGEIKSETISSYGNLVKKKLHTICIDKNNNVELIECNQFIRDKYIYAISGLPVTLNKKDVSWSKVVKPQGWTGGELRATKHICLSYKDNYIYVIGIDTVSKTPGTAITEIYRKLKYLGLDNILKLDGGGSTVIDWNGKNVFVTSENRIVNNLIYFND